jgi:hypothetical protein
MKLPIRPAEAALLSAVLGLALVLRVWGNAFGLPHVYHPDEGFEVYRALRLAMGGFDFDRVAKGGFYFLLFLEYGVYFVLRFVTGAVGGVGDFAREFAADPTAFWLIGRTTNGVLGAATAFLVWWQARRMGSSRAGLLGALFLAVSFRHVVDSHYATVDIPMTLFAFWAVVMVVEDLSGRSRLSWWKYGLVAAFAVLNKLPAIVIFLPYLAGAFLRGGWRAPEGLLGRRTWLPLVTAAGIYLVANPGFVLNIVQMFALVGGTLGGTEAGGEYAGVEQKTNLWAYYFGVLVRSQGPGILALATVAAVIGAVRRSQGTLLHLAFLVPFYCLIAGATSAHLYYARYVVPLLPGLCLLAGLGLEDLVQRARPRSERLATVVMTAVALVLAVEPALTSIGWDQLQSRTDTRTMAASWVEENVEHRARVLLEGFPEEESQLAVPLPNTRRNVKDMIASLERTDPGKAKFWAIKLDTLEKPLYDLVTIRHYEPWISVDEARAAGIEWVLLRREYFVEGERSAAKHDPEIVGSRFAFHRELLDRPDVAALAARFDAEELDHPGFDIEIWHLAPLAPSTGEEPPGGPPAVES